MKYFGWSRASAIVGLTVFALLSEEPNPYWRRVRLPLREYLRNTTTWALGHSKEVGARLSTSLPFIDVYNPIGEPLLHSEDQVHSANVLRRWPPDLKVSALTSIRPSLSEALNMVPDLEAKANDLISRGIYTIIAVTLADCPACRTQDAAVAELRARLGKNSVQLIEVQLVK
jgi:hypothetical protein